MRLSRTVMCVTFVLNVVGVFSADIDFDDFYSKRLLSYLRQKYPGNIFYPANDGLSELSESPQHLDLYKKLKHPDGVFSAMSKKAHVLPYTLNEPSSSRHTRITPFGQYVQPDKGNYGEQRKIFRHGK
ncbi:hypothetical protein DPMN_151269 [Dreissena polymorpha]|uniref:Uncharacterized protein n=1 Tax=Dreissena polymorpha TaxID=45954 RepID=A0A9D4FHA3_DREPO|nr:hypothetical protein DPMN_151269 [Dreissena polymorpha]